MLCLSLVGGVSSSRVDPALDGSYKILKTHKAFHDFGKRNYIVRQKLHLKMSERLAEEVQAKTSLLSKL